MQRPRAYRKAKYRERRRQETIDWKAFAASQVEEYENIPGSRSIRIRNCWKCGRLTNWTVYGFIICQTCAPNFDPEEGEMIVINAFLGE